MTSDEAPPPEPARSESRAGLARLAPLLITAALLALLGVILLQRGKPMVSNPILLPGLPAMPEALTSELRQALVEQPQDYQPRAHHLLPSGEPKYINRLIRSQSPYLLQHAHNPVNWFPWGPEAFAAARESDRPILLSVGYSTCHWCHVMERESFEDEEIAAVINEKFIPIKVDREERPDVDAVYMTAVQLATGGGGWPMTIIMTPEKKPFFAGTYFPARDGDRGARIGFLTILARISEAWASSRESIEADAIRLTKAVQGANQPKPPDGLPGVEALIEAVRFMARVYDQEWGGFGRAPKFPRPSTYELLLRYARRSEDATALSMVVQSLRKMSQGGMYDHLGGGFARYSTDREWLVPHFEKMLYDNAQLASLLTEAWQVTGDRRFAQTLRETLDYVLREMTSDNGGFYSATDADSEGVEGKYFTWTQDQIYAVLGPERGARFADAYGVSIDGNFEGTNVLNLAKPLDAVLESWSSSSSLPLQALEKSVEDDRAKLRIAREKRIAPLLDDKIITEWNAQMISALARAGIALGDARYTAAAVRGASFMVNELRHKDGALRRAWRGGQVFGRAVLEDYANSISALLDVFESTSDGRWLRAAIELTAHMVEHFWDEDSGGFFATGDSGEALLVRDKPGYDGAQPSGNSVAALALLRLASWTANLEYRERADRTLLAFGQLLQNGAIQNPKMAQALDWRLDRPKEVLIVTTDADDGGSLTDVLRRTFLPNAVRLVIKERELPSLLTLVPWTEAKKAQNGRATAYVCLEGLCKTPTSDPETFARQLEPEVKIEAPPVTLGRTGKAKQPETAN